MIFSKGTPVWSDMSSLFVNVDRLALFLKKNQFTGAIRLNTNSRMFVILMADGDIVAGAEKDPGRDETVSFSVDRILAAVEEHSDVRITVSKLEKDLVEIFSRLYDRNVLNQGKSVCAECSDPDTYLKSKKNENYSGYLCLNFPRSSRTAVISLANGIVEAVVSDSIHLTRKDSEESRDRMARMLLSKAKVKGAGIHSCSTG
ncbi:MAG: hypothetical protein K9J83_05920 [Desulfarculaceae bacterium]|nr:hypothetical protein [Desulfarculaceae bacterium]